MNICRLIFICLAGISCLCSCSQKEEVGLGAYCGSYVVESVSWTGLPVDVNGDGVLPDAIGYMDGQLTMGKYPDKIRRVKDMGRME